jgi:hypothetical protein
MGSKRYNTVIMNLSHQHYGKIFVMQLNSGEVPYNLKTGDFPGPRSLWFRMIISARIAYS